MTNTLRSACRFPRTLAAATVLAAAITIAPSVAIAAPVHATDDAPSQATRYPAEPESLVQAGVGLVSYRTLYAHYLQCSDQLNSTMTAVNAPTHVALQRATVALGHSITDAQPDYQLPLGAPLKLLGAITQADAARAADVAAAHAESQEVKKAHNAGIEYLRVAAEYMATLPDEQKQSAEYAAFNAKYQELYRVAGIKGYYKTVTDVNKDAAALSALQMALITSVSSIKGQTDTGNDQTEPVKDQAEPDKGQEEPAKDQKEPAGTQTVPQTPPDDTQSTDQSPTEPATGAAANSAAPAADPDASPQHPDPAATASGSPIQVPSTDPVPHTTGTTHVAQSSPTPRVAPATPTSLIGTATIKEAAGAGLQVWTKHGKPVRNRDGSLKKLPRGSKWHCFNMTIFIGKTKFYNLGGDQYVDAAYVNFAAK